MNKKFVTLFPQAQNVHLRKGVGQIPYILYRDHNIDATLVCFQNENSYPGLQNDTPGLKLEFLNSRQKKSPLSASVKYLFAHAKNIDALHLFGQSRWTLIVGALYKLLNAKGVLFIKMDMNVQYLQRLMHSKYNSRHLIAWNYFFKNQVNFISSEYAELTQLLKSFYTISGDKIIQLPNGVDDKAIEKLPFKRNSFAEKENIILYVGRVGAAEKNNEMLLSAASKIDLKNWKVYFVGPVEKSFQEKIDSFFKLHNSLKDKIIFVGEVIDFAQLCQWYNRSKIFCLTSLREGFPVVVPEAMYWGNYIVSTDVSSIKEALDFGEIGAVAEDEEKLVKHLQQLIDHPDEIEKITELSIKKAEQEYVWSKLVAKIYSKLQEEFPE